jgi:hypothetical protein
MGNNVGKAIVNNPSVLYSLIGDNPIGGHSIEFVVWEYGECKYLLISWSSVCALWIVATKDDVCWSFGSTQVVWVCSTSAELQGEFVVGECEW